MIKSYYSKQKYLNSELIILSKLKKKRIDNKQSKSI